jgi:hypothetical protein
MPMTIYDKENVYKDFNKFIKKYGALYPDFAKQYILEHFESDINECYRSGVINQVYAEIGILPDEENTYKDFINLMKKKYNIYSNILEIGSGFIPTMAQYIDDEQRSVSGTITVYDPELIIEKRGNIKLFKNNFTCNDSVNDYDLIIAVAACEASKMLIRKANDANKDFMIALCGCVHLPDNYPSYMYYDCSYYHNYMFDIASNNLDSSRELNVDYLDDNY